MEYQEQNNPIMSLQWNPKVLFKLKNNANQNK